jgi:hypothetical protein
MNENRGKNMKKILMFLLLVGCGGYIQNENGSENLKRLDSKPNNCSFLYKLESDVSVYDEDDAIRYLENRIVDQENPGNAYLITSQRMRQNPSAIFGPKNTFIFVANVYDCPDM